MRTEDGYIIQKCLDGDATAFGFLVNKYRDPVYALAYSRVHNFHDAQDITQEVFIKAYRKLRDLRHWDNFMGWLYRITNNMCRDWLRSRYRRPDREFVEDQDPGILDRPSMDFYHENELYESIHYALDSLPELYSQVLILRYFGEMTTREMSRFLAVSISTVERRLREARIQLKEGTLAMMSTSYRQHELPATFTFRIVEAVKHIRINPMPRIAGVPWGLSLVAGLIITILSLNPHPEILDPVSFPIFSSPSVEAGSLEGEEIPVFLMADSEILPPLGKQEDVAEGLHFGEAQVAANKGRIVFSRSDNIWVMDATGKNERQLTVLDDKADMDPVWSPDGTQIAFTRWSDDGNSGDIYVMKANGSGVRQLTEGPEYDLDPCWSPDGQQIAFSRIVIEKKGDQWKWISGAIYVVDIDGSDLVNLTEGLPFAGDPDWSSDGSKIVFHIDNADDITKPYEIWTMDSDGRNRRKLITGGRNPDWSPDGNSIAFSRQEGAGIPSNIYVMDADGANIRRVNDPWPSWEESPKWSPDGTKIIFFSNKDEDIAIYIMDVDGSNVQRLTNNPDWVDRFPDWTAFSYAMEPAGKLPTTWAETKSS